MEAQSHLILRRRSRSTNRAVYANVLVKAAAPRVRVNAAVQEKERERKKDRKKERTEC